MARAPLRLCALMAMLVLAAADFGGWSSSSRLDGVCFATTNQFALAQTAGATDVYYVTTGNGTWLYPNYLSPYYTPATAGQGDVTYPAVSSLASDFVRATENTGTFYNQWITFSNTLTNPNGQAQTYTYSPVNTGGAGGPQPNSQTMLNPYWYSTTASNNPNAYPGNTDQARPQQACRSGHAPCLALLGGDTYSPMQSLLLGVPPPPSYINAPATTAPALTGVLPAYGTYYSVATGYGLTSVTFPSKSLGIAVGGANFANVQPIAPLVGGAFHGSTSSTDFPGGGDQGTEVAYPLYPGGTLDGTQLGKPQQPTVLITIDGGASWQQVSGVPQYTTSAAVMTYAAGANVGGATYYPMPPTGAPDLYCVYFAAKSLGWAVGGNAALAAWATGLQMSYASIPLGPDFATGPASVLMTTNGGTVWRNVPVVYDQVSVYAAYAAGPAIGAAYYGAWQPGTLMSVSADATGQYVYSVGLVPWQIQAINCGAGGAGSNQCTAAGSPCGTGGCLTNPSTLTTFGNSNGAQGTLATPTQQSTQGPNAANFGTHWVNTQPFGTILYSSSAGTSWTLQSAPSLPSLYNYVLTDVTVGSKGSIAFAVGGSLYNPTAAGVSITLAGGSPGTAQPTVYTGPGFGNGVILTTANSGATWTLASYPGAAYGTAPAFTSVAFNSGVGWVVGYTYDVGTLFTSAGQPVNTYPSTYWPATAGATSFTQTVTYPVNGQAVQLTYNGNNVPTATLTSVVGLSYTVLLSTDGGNTWQPAPTGSFPAGFVLTGNTNNAPGPIPAEAVALQPDILGIVWDSALHGWMYGMASGIPGTSGFILSTGNGGATWTYETPSDVVANGMHVYALTNVPAAF